METFAPVGKELTARVIKIDYKNRRFGLSVIAHEKNLNAKQIEESQEGNKLECSDEEPKAESNETNNQQQNVD